MGHQIGHGPPPHGDSELFALLHGPQQPRELGLGFKCADGYYSGIDMATARHPQTILALDFGGGALPREYGYPMRLRMPTKLGFKNAKHIAALFVTNDYPGGYWEDKGYNWFSGS